MLDMDYVGALARHERDQLYPGMHIDLIPAYEKIMGHEEPTAAWGLQFAGAPSTPA